MTILLHLMRPESYALLRVGRGGTRAQRVPENAPERCLRSFPAHLPLSPRRVHSRRRTRTAETAPLLRYPAVEMCEPPASTRVEFRMATPATSPRRRACMRASNAGNLQVQTSKLLSASSPSIDGGGRRHWRYRRRGPDSAGRRRLRHGPNVVLSNPSLARDDFTACFRHTQQHLSRV